MPEIDVKLNHIKKKFGNTVAVDDVSLEIEKGLFVTLLGPSGCGKTTTLRIIAGLTEPDGGRVHIKGRDVTDVMPHKRNIGMFFQSYALFPHMNVFDNICFGLRMRKIDEGEMNSRVNKVLELVRLEGLEERRMSQLSGGQQQRVALARALVIEPDVLLLDEPLSNLDAKLRESMRVELKQLQRKLGLTTIFVTHDQTEALVLSDLMIVMNEGRISDSGTPHEIYSHPKNSFIAGFIGRANFFDCKLSVENKTITTDDGLVFEVELDDYSNFNEDQRVRAAIRPEMIKIDSPKAKGNNIVTGKIGFVTYEGPNTQYILNLDSGKILTVAIQSSRGTPTHKIGDTLHMRLNPEDFIIME